jgi:putative transcriptional regulator
MVRKSLKAIKAAKPKLDRAKIAATTESDIRRHMREDGETPARTPRLADVMTPQIIRKRLDMTQEEFAQALHIPVATLRNWEQGRNAIDPAARSLLIVVARNPKAALAALAADADVRCALACRR